MSAFRVVGVGPGDPELVTLKAARLIREAGVVAYHQGVGKSSNARRIVADLVSPGTVEEVLQYPVTTGVTDHPGGYDGAMSDFYDECEQRVGAHLAQGRDVVLLAEGDPLLYGSAMYLHDRLSERHETAIVPGVPAFAAATAAAGTPLVRHTDVLTVLPGTLDEPELARRLADTDGAIIMKLGRTFAKVRSAMEQAGRLDGALYVERASMAEERSMPVADVDPATVPYFSLIVVPGDTKPVPRPRDVRPSATAEVLVVGLGPGPDRWLTPEVEQALAEVGHVVGYAPYVERVPQRAGLQRHASGNTVEVDRARLALDLALSGEKVAVVSGGDAGVFGMASAVFEAAEDPQYADVHVKVLPGVSAVQAVAARAGAPVGADFAVLSLSDRLKPWDVVEARVRAIARADLVLAVYNPRSRARPTQVGELRSILLEERPGDTVVVVGRDVGRAEESLTVTTLEALDPETIDMKCLLVIGASSTRVTASGQVWTPRFVDPTPSP
ncbi:ATP-binding protein [Aeromicrobium sp. Root495]|uniref:precorrin-2 C(20)-methyltransferase n=1 Tax=Aeromicrobium sp. Root495 TaxID=1736550 RepID=UPI0006FA5074|nr:precorrin-2 C(20)-methyltransferase [Aeromicrobium sp. Root495]KQY60482.1 ATP-binding protein [Aeromicrobium sp. Root495]